MADVQKSPKYDEKAWKTYVNDKPALFKDMPTLFKNRKKGRISKRDLRKCLECDRCFEWHFQDSNQDTRKKLISRLIDRAKGDGYSTELFEYWLNNRDCASHGHLQTLTL